jgi:hypothetical protein
LAGSGQSAADPLTAFTAFGNKSTRSTCKHSEKGSVANIYAVCQKAKTRLGIVRSDMLAIVAKVETNPVPDSINEMLPE